MATTKTNVFKKIHAVMKDVGIVPETGQTTAGSRYKYASDFDLINALRPAMIEHGLVMVPTQSEIIALEPYKAGGNPWNHYQLVQSFRLVDIDNPDSFVDIQVAAEGADRGDKSIYKANTGAQKYALRLVFNVPTGDDPDDTSTAEQYTTERRQPQREAPPKKEELSEEEKAEKLTKALGFAVPNLEGVTLPYKGDSFEDVQKDAQVGPLVILWLARRIKNHKNEMFEPTEDQKAIVGAARFVIEHSPDFQEPFKTFKEANPELFKI